MLKCEKPKFSKRFPPTRNFDFLENFDMAGIATCHNMKINVRPFQILTFVFFDPPYSAANIYSLLCVMLARIPLAYSCVAPELRYSRP